MDVTELASNLQLILGPPEDLRPINVGLLMFSESPERFFRYARIEVVEIPDPTGDGMTEKTFAGPTQRQLRDTLAYIRNNTIKELVKKDSAHAEAQRTFNYPYAAVEEILANSVYHRSYQISEPIVVRISPAEIEVTSFPGFDRSISDNDVAAGKIRARRYRNRRIGDFLKELKLIEGRNTGFPNAYQALERNGSDPLKFQMDEARGYLSVSIPVHAAFTKGSDSRATKKVREYEAAILSALESCDMTLTELARSLGYKGISKKLRDSVEALVTRGELERATVAGRSGTVLRRRKR